MDKHVITLSPSSAASTSADGSTASSIDITAASTSYDSYIKLQAGTDDSSSGDDGTTIFTVIHSGSVVTLAIDGSGSSVTLSGRNAGQTSSAAASYTVGSKFEVGGATLRVVLIDATSVTLEPINTPVPADLPALQPATGRDEDVEAAGSVVNAAAAAAAAAAGADGQQQQGRPASIIPTSVTVELPARPGQASPLVVTKQPQLVKMPEHLQGVYAPLHKPDDPTVNDPLLVPSVPFDVNSEQDRHYASDASRPNFPSLASFSGTRGDHYADAYSAHIQLILEYSDGLFDSLRGLCEDEGIQDKLNNMNFVNLAHELETRVSQLRNTTTLLREMTRVDPAHKRLVIPIEVVTRASGLLKAASEHLSSFQAAQERYWGAEQRVAGLAQESLGG